MENTDQTFIDCWSLLEKGLTKLKEQGRIIDFEKKGPEIIQRWESFFVVYYNSSRGRSLAHLKMPGLHQHINGRYFLRLSINNCLLENDIAALIEKRLPKDRILIEA